MRTNAAAVPVRLVHEGDPIDEFGVETAAPPVCVPETAAAAPARAHLARMSLTIQGRWFVLVAVLALLVIGQTPFVVLWALDFGGSVPVVITSRDTLRHQFEMPPAPIVPVTAHFGSPASSQPSRVKAVAPAPRGALSGWLKIDVPIPLRILENGELLGTTEVDRLMLPVGEHLLDLQNDDLRFRIQRTVDIAAGETATVQFELPRSSLSINARPWAEAWVDGERVGDTPIGNLLRPIGRHEVVLRHPKLGEHRESVLVTLSQPARVSVDLRGGSAQ